MENDTCTSCLLTDIFAYLGQPPGAGTFRWASTSVSSEQQGQLTRQQVPSPSPSPLPLETKAFQKPIGKKTLFISRTQLDSMFILPCLMLSSVETPTIQIAPVSTQQRNCSSCTCLPGVSGAGARTQARAVTSFLLDDSLPTTPGFYFQHNPLSTVVATVVLLMCALAINPCTARHTNNQLPKIAITRCRCAAFSRALSLSLSGS